MIIDAHAHCWEIGRAPYEWLTPVPGIHRTIDLTELQPLLAETGVERTVLVSSDDNRQDNDYLLEVAESSPEVAGVVAWAPLADPDRAEPVLDELRTHPKFCGIRIGINHEADPDVLISAGVTAGLDVLQRRDIPFDVVSVRRRHLELVPILSERHPDLRMVIDHLSKPPVKRDDESFWRPWRTNLARSAENPNVFAKVSGLFPAGGDMTNWSAADVRPVVDYALEHFGASRLMFGSDWPIANLAGGYVKVWNELNVVFAELTEAERAAVLGGTAQHFYRLDTEPTSRGAA